MELVGGMGHWMFSLSDRRNGNSFRADFDLFSVSRHAGGRCGLQPHTSDVFAKHTLLLWMAQVSSGECENR